MKTLRLAVIGAPVSGKTYLLSDLIHSLAAIGYQPVTLPLDYPYSSFGSFFYEISNFTYGAAPHQHSFKGTEAYAARQENRYGAILRHPRSRQHIAIDFLNIPGEVFQDNSQTTHKGGQQRLKLFFELRKAIARSTSEFLVATYTNPAGRTVRLIEPSQQVTARLGRPHRHDAPADTLPPPHRQRLYMEWADIYGELSRAHFRRQSKTRRISGQHLLDHFFDYLPDSFLLTLRAAWPLIGGRFRLRYEDYDALNVLPFFYFMEYTRQATDIVLCDRLYAQPPTPVNPTPGTTPHTPGTTATNPYTFNFEDLTETLGHYYTPFGHRRPNVYLAFRCADHAMQHPATQQALAQAAHAATNPHQRRQAPYDLFVSSLLARLQDSDTTATIGTPPSATGIDPDIATRPTAIGSKLADHLRTRIGRDAGHAFCRLLRMSAPKLSLVRPHTWAAVLRRRWRRQPTLRRDFRLPDALPPQVYFTATPIDIDFRIYTNDPDDQTQFVHTDADGHLRSFHIETTLADRPAMCFGSYQLMRDILRFNGISTPI